MNEHDFVFWLNGFFELSGATSLKEEQVKVIKEHIALVLHKVTPSTVGTGTPLQQTSGPYTFPVPNCDCHGVKQDQLPIINVPTHLTC
jgi:hypothetical protein